MLCCGVSEVISITTVIPFLNMVTDPEMVNNYAFLIKIMDFINFYRPLVISGCSSNPSQPSKSFIKTA